MPNTIRLYNTPNNFQAGKAAQRFSKWTDITSDQNLLSWVAGVTIDFHGSVDQNIIPEPIHFTEQDSRNIDNEVAKLRSQGVIETSSPSNGQFVSNIFCRPKKDGSIRLILNLKNLNVEVEYHHFKMETLHHAIQLMTPGCFMGSIDLKHAYYNTSTKK